MIVHLTFGVCTVQWYCSAADSPVYKENCYGFQVHVFPVAQSVVKTINYRVLKWNNLYHELLVHIDMVELAAEYWSCFMYKWLMQVREFHIFVIIEYKEQLFLKYWGDNIKYFVYYFSLHH